jgi:hypothetical protein
LSVSLVHCRAQAFHADFLLCSLCWATKKVNGGEKCRVL